MSQQFPVTLKDVVRFSWDGAADPSFSADGRRVVYTDRGSIWQVDVSGGGPRRLTRGTRPHSSPATDEIAFLRGRPRGPAQLWIWDAARGAERSLTALETGVHIFSWSPDGRRIALVSPLTEPQPPDRAALPETIIEVHRRTLPPGVALVIVDPATGESEVMARSEPGVEWLMVVWRPDGGSLALWERVPDRGVSGVGDHPAVFELATGGFRYPAGQNQRPSYFLCWSPDSTHLALSHSPHDFLHPFRSVLGIVDAAGGEIACRANDYLLEEVGGYGDERTVYCTGVRGVGQQVLRVDTVTGAVRPLTEGAGDHCQPRVSPDRQWLACTYRNPTTLPEVTLHSTDGRECRRLTRVNERLKRFRLAEVEIVRWPAPDGLEIEGILVKPLDFDSKRRYPTIVDVHGGPVGGVRADCRPEWHWLAAQGYQVFAPDFRGGQTYGWVPPVAEAEPGYEELDFHDIMTGVDWLVESGSADRERLGVRGVSYGAGMINRILGRTDRFRAAVAWAGGILPLEVDWAGIHGGNAILAREFGGRPWEAPEVYARHNPMTRLHHARTPTLILNGEPEDDLGARALYTWLHQLGVPVEYVVYRGEGHTIRKPEHREDCWRRTLAWFDRYLRR